MQEYGRGVKAVKRGARLRAGDRGIQTIFGEDDGTFQTGDEYGNVIFHVVHGDVGIELAEQGVGHCFVIAGCYVTQFTDEEFDEKHFGACFEIGSERGDGSGVRAEAGGDGTMIGGEEDAGPKHCVYYRFCWHVPVGDFDRGVRAPLPAE